MIETLQSLRFIFFVMIFMSHFGYDGRPTFDAGGDCGVSFFFILSGFVMTLAYGEKAASEGFRYRHFIARRVAKLYPLHLLCLLAFVVINIKSMDAEALMRLLPNLLLIQSWLPTADYYFSGNAVSWFLSDILLCYAVFPFVCRAIRRMTPAVLAFTWAAVLMTYSLLLCNVTDAMTNSIVYIFPPVRTVDFALGMTLWRVAEWTKRHRPGILESRLAINAAELAATLAAHPYINLQIRTACLFWPVCAAVILLFVCERQGGVVAWLLRRKALIWLGNITFPMFMVHQMAINVTLRTSSRISGFIGEPSYTGMLTLCAATTLLAATLALKIGAEQRAKSEE